MNFYIWWAFLSCVACAAAFFAGRKSQKSDNEEAVISLGEKIPQVLEDLSTWQRKAGEYLEKINEVIEERENWRQLYFDQAAGHDNAQALMLETISSVCFAYRKETGKDFKVDPIIKTAHGEWQKTHGAEAREERGEDGRRESSENESV